MILAMRDTSSSACVMSPLVARSRMGTTRENSGTVIAKITSGSMKH